MKAEELEAVFCKELVEQELDDNTRYFDIADDFIPEPAEGRIPTRIGIEYVNEMLLGEETAIRSARKNSTVYIEGTGEKPFFRIAYTYEEAGE